MIIGERLLKSLGIGKNLAVSERGTEVCKLCTPFGIQCERPVGSSIGRRVVDLNTGRGVNRLPATSDCQTAIQVEQSGGVVTPQVFEGVQRLRVGVLRATL